jgi:hypothetical protein
MKQQTVKSLLMLAIFITFAAIAQAQSGEKVEATIPFNFLVRNQALPAGQYTIAHMRFGMSEGLRFRSRDGHFNAIVLIDPSYDGKYQKESKLVFQRYGDQYILAQVWIAGYSESHSIKPPDSDEIADYTGARAKQLVTIHARQR